MATYPPPPFSGGYPYAYPYAAAYPPPAAGFFPAPPPASGFFPATYQQPFPFAPPAFPYVATYPYPPPASAYTPPSGFSPNWPPLPTPSDPTSSQIDLHQPPPAPPTNQGDPHQAIRFPCSQAHAPPPESVSPTTAQTWVASAPSPALDPRAQQNDDLLELLKLPNRQIDAFQRQALDLPAHTGSHVSPVTKETDKYLAPEKLAHASRPKNSKRRTPVSSPPSRMRGASTLLELPDAAQPAKPDVTYEGGDLTKGYNTWDAPSPDEEFVRKHTGSGILPISNAGPDHCVVTHQATAATTTVPTLESTAMTTATSSLFSSAPLVFSAVPVSVAPKVLGEMPERYGLHNLNRRNLFRADGTEHSYFTLPADYPLERAAPEPMFAVYDDKSDGRSTESVHELTGTPEQLTNEEEQHENLQGSKCFCKPTFSPERPTVDNVGVFSLTNEQKLDNELCGQSVKTQQVNYQQWDMLITVAGRKEWDPGTLKIITDVPTVVKWSSSEGLPHAVLLSMIVYAATYIPNILVSLPLHMPWDQELHYLLPHARSNILVKQHYDLQHMQQHLMVQVVHVSVGVHVFQCVLGIRNWFVNIQFMGPWNCNFLVHV